MGTWEVGIYQNELSADVKEDYISKLKAGKSDEQALAEMLDEYKEEADDIDCKCDLFIALAGIMWDKGRLTEEIKQRALAEIEEDKTAERWEGEKIRQKRCIELEKFKEKLESEMPPRKKVPVHRPYKAGWIEGGVYCFQITETIDGYEEYTGWYATFYVDKVYKEDWIVRGVWDEVADAYFFLSKDKPQSADDIKRMKNILFSWPPIQINYEAEILESSKRQRPKDLTYLGKCGDFRYPHNDKYSNKDLVFWGYCTERDLVWGYVKQLEYERSLSGNEN